MFNNPLKVPDLAHLNKLKTIAIDEPQFNDMVANKMHLKFDQEPQFRESVIILSKQ